MAEYPWSRRVTRRMTVVSLLLAVLLGALGACARSTVSSGAAPAPSAARHLIANHGHELAFYVTPGHSPVIVLDSGGGQDASYWKNLVPQLAKQTGSEIITYDRAGLGASDEVPGPWNIDSAVSDLDAGLTQLGVTRDVILVSHSEAGEIATYFVRDHPHVVSGAVLVDASLPPFYTDDEIARIEAANQAQIAGMRPTTKANRQLLAVAADYVPLHHAYHQLTWSPSVPATVIESATTPFPTSPQDAQRWRDAQAAFAAAAPNRTLVIAARSTHDVPIDRPDVVINAVQHMATTLR